MCNHFILLQTNKMIVDVKTINKRPIPLTTIPILSKTPAITNNTNE